MTQTELSAGAKHRRAMTVTFGFTFTYFVVEVIGGIVTNSLALLADATRWPTFNLADSFIVLGVTMLLWTSLMSKNSEQDQ